MSPDEPTGETPRASRSRKRPIEQDERIRLGLIGFVQRHSIDSDYQRVAGERTPGRPARTGRSRAGAMLALALFALLIFVAASQTSRGSAASAQERADLVDQVDARRDALDENDALARSLSLGNQALRDDLSRTRAGDLSTRVRRLEVVTGAVAVTGPGVVMVADDKADADSDRERVLDKDLQRLVNGLWQAGAEAISVNGQRISNLTSIREAGGTINVNYLPVRAPYTVRAVGDPDTLASRFADSTSGSSWFDLVQQVGLRLRITTAQRLKLPASDRLTLRDAEPAKGDAS